MALSWARAVRICLEMERVMTPRVSEDMVGGSVDWWFLSFAGLDFDIFNMLGCGLS
jgi:hypothetical protein